MRTALQTGRRLQFIHLRRQQSHWSSWGVHGVFLQQSFQRHSLLTMLNLTSLIKILQLLFVEMQMMSQQDALQGHYQIAAECRESSGFSVMRDHSRHQPRQPHLHPFHLMRVRSQELKPSDPPKTWTKQSPFSWLRSWTSLSRLKTNMLHFLSALMKTSTCEDS